MGNFPCSAVHHRRIYVVSGVWADRRFGNRSLLIALESNPGKISVAKLMPGSKVLIVDDEKIFADTLAQIFRNEGFDCLAVYSAEQAIETIATWEPALSIIDVMLPGMNGIDLVILLKATHPSMGVMMISGQVATGGLVEQAAKLGHEFDIFPKPFPVPELLSNASRILAGVINPLPPNSPLAN